MKNKTRTVFAYLVTLIAVALRSFQLLNTVDAQTGNIINAYIPIQKFFDIGLLAALVAVIVIAFFSKPKTESFTCPSKSLGIASAFLAASLLFDGFKLMFQNFTSYKGINIIEMVLFGFSIFAALYFVSLSISMFSKKQIFPNPLLPAFVIVCFVLKLLSQYLLSVQNAAISERKYSILMYASFTLFWIFYARYCNLTRKSKRLVSLFTLLTVFCSGVTLIPRAVAFIVPKILPSLYTVQSNVFYANELFLADVATLVFAIVFLYYINKEEKEVEEEDDFLYEGIKGVSTEDSVEEIKESVFGTKEDSPSQSVEEIISQVIPEIEVEIPPVSEPVIEEITPATPFVVTFEEDIFGEETQKDKTLVEETKPESAEEPEIIEALPKSESAEQTDGAKVEEASIPDETEQSEVTAEAEEVTESEQPSQPEAIEETMKDEVQESIEPEKMPVFEESVEFEEIDANTFEPQEVQADAFIPQKTVLPQEEQTEEIKQPQIDENASADDIINNLLDEIMGIYGEDN